MRQPEAKQRLTGTTYRIQRPSYDERWIKEGLRKHQANFSMVVLFDSNDPKRLEQLKAFFCAGPEGYKTHDIYIYNPWDGLEQIDRRTGKAFPVTAEGGRFGEELSNRIRDLAGCLNWVDARLRTRSTILILHGLNRVQSGNESLLSAVRAWAVSGELMSQRSLVVLFGSVFLSILDEETKDLVAIVDVPIGEESEYGELVDYLAKLYNIHVDRDVVSKGIRGLNLHQAEAVLLESYWQKKYFDPQIIKRSKSELVKKAAVVEIEEPQEGFESIGGYQVIKDFVKKKIVDVIMDKAKRARDFGISPPRGILFFGPPGTGKTLFAKALAKAVELPFLNLKTENIYSPWLGESGQRMRNAIKIVEQMSPAIVFIDEIDRFGQRASTTDSAGEETRRVFSQLLEWLGDKNRKAIIVGTTNVPEHLDDAFIRTGRFDYKIPIGYPNESARLAILRLHLGLPDDEGKPSPKPRPPLNPSSVDEFVTFLREEIVPRTELYTGAELEELVTRAKRIAFETDEPALKPEHLIQSLRSFRIDREARQEQHRKFLQYVEKYTDDAAFLEENLG